ncbi:MAG: ribosome recycling factor [Christensenellales bacterium]|jgi:ribosome recycling factor
MEDAIIVKAAERMEKSLANLKKEFVSLRAGRANPQLLDRVTVDYYGTATPISQVANISAPEPRMIMISLWDPSMIPTVEKAIQQSDLGINPSNDGKVIRLVIPELTEERRKDLVKTVRKKAEDCKVAVRSIRRDAIEDIKKEKKEGLMTEDDQRLAEDAAQKLTDKMIKQIDEASAAKEKEIMEI